MSPAVPRAAHVPVRPDSLLGRERVHPRRANFEEVSETMDCVLSQRFGFRDKS